MRLRRWISTGQSFCSPRPQQNSMGRIFQEQSAADTIQAGLHIDKKRRRMLREKRMALGHKADDHEGSPQQHQR